LPYVEWRPVFATTVKLTVVSPPDHHGKLILITKSGETLLRKLEGDPDSYTWKGQRVITFAMMDVLHGKAKGATARNFQRHHHQMCEGRDYFSVPQSEVPPALVCGDNKSPQKTDGRGGTRYPVILLTERGYVTLATCFHDPLAWRIRDRLVDYFVVPQSEVPPALIGGDKTSPPNAGGRGGNRMPVIHAPASSPPASPPRLLPGPGRPAGPPRRRPRPGARQGPSRPEAPSPPTADPRRPPPPASGRCS
jgi:hypothetical protein